MKIFGNKKEFAITYTPDLERYADDPDVIQNPDEYLLGGCLCFWVKDKNLFAFKDWGPDATYGYYTLHYVVDFLTSCLIHHISEVPFPIKTKSTNAIDMIEETALVKSDVEDELQACANLDWDSIDMEIMEKRDNWMHSRSFLINDGGTFLPNIMIRKVKDKIEISWHNRHPHSNGEHKFYMLYEKGVEYVDANLYKDVIVQFCSAYIEHIQEKEPKAAELYRKHLEETSKRPPILTI